MNFKDVLGLGKILPIDKLLEVISTATGRISKSYFDKKDIETKAKEIIMLAEARAKEIHIISDALKISHDGTGGIEYKDAIISINSPKESTTSFSNVELIDARIDERIQDRLILQEAKKQHNIESITAFAAEELKNESPIDNVQIDEDWTTRFFKIAEDVSNEEMQTLWGKILAGEVKKPSSYSLRTLEMIRNLSKYEADTFAKVANFAISSGGKHYLFKGNNDNTLGQYGISYMDIALLTEIGLIQPGDFVEHQFIMQAVNTQRILIAGNIIIIINIKANTPTVQMPVNVFSTSGNELLKLVKPMPPLDYLTFLAKAIRNENVDVKYAYIIADLGESVQHTNPLMDFV